MYTQTVIYVVHVHTDSHIYGTCTHGLSYIYMVHVHTDSHIYGMCTHRISTNMYCNIKKAVTVKLCNTNYIATTIARN